LKGWPPLTPASDPDELAIALHKAASRYGVAPSPLNEHLQAAGEEAKRADWTPLQRVKAAEEIYRKDAASRARYERDFGYDHDCARDWQFTDEAWMLLALRLLVRHREPGFQKPPAPPPAVPRQTDGYELEDLLRDAAFASGTRSAAQAAREVEATLKDWKKRGLYAGIVRQWDGIAVRWSKEKKARAVLPPASSKEQEARGEALAGLAHDPLWERLVGVARRITRSISAES
jgi:hypothetical protein